MDEDDWETAVTEGVDVDFVFDGARPNFGDLLAGIGISAPDFAPSGARDLSAMQAFGFAQVDDYFGIPNASDDGTDVVVWLYPLIDDEPVDHHAGPFDGLRVSYCVLRNPPARVATFLGFVDALARATGVAPHYRLRDISLDDANAKRVLTDDLAAIVAHWREQGIEPGTDDALAVDY